MCAIAGIFSFGADGPPISIQELIACRDHMASRGPDASGLWVDESQRLGLAHRRLAIIDLDARASQPMMTPQEDLVIVFNGEIYNYKELRAELQQAGYQFRTTSDTEVILHLYRHMGRKLLEKLRGMYAFAIWDAQHHELFLARDPYGIKPLYYSCEDGVFRFASQVKALLAGGGIPSDPCSAGWAGFYLFGSVPEPWTTFRAIRSLPAGHNLVVSHRGPQSPERHYSLAETLVRCEEKRPTGSLRSQPVKTQVRDALIDSIRHHLVADVPIGTFLSGGIDSGALVGLMRDAGQTDIHTLTLGFNEFSGKPEDEAPLAAQVALTYGTKHSTRHIDEEEFRADLHHIITAMDLPTIDGLNTWFVSKAAKELGLKVVLSGLGGDELFGGYPSFNRIPKLVEWTSSITALPGLSPILKRAISAIDLARFGLHPKARGLLEYGRTYPGAYLLQRGLFLPHELASIMPQEEATVALQQLIPFELIHDTIAPRPQRGFAKVCALESSLYMRNQLLRDTDWTSMAHSIEVRAPLVDIRLLDSIAHLPLDRPEFAGKFLLKEAPSTPLPTIVRERAKTGFVTPIAQWLQRLPAPTQSPAMTMSLRNQPWARRWALLVADYWSKTAFPQTARPSHA